MHQWKGCALALAAILAGGPAWAADIGKPASEFTIATFDNQKVLSAELRGKVVVLNYWATWCTPCKAEMIAFDRYMRNHPGTDLKIYAIATENSVPPRYLEPLSKALSFPLARKLSGRGYGVMKAVPTSYVIDRAGVVRYAEAGAFDDRSFEAVVGPLLAEKEPQAAAPPATP
jgi:cytochrome c biogenesis protein CcmG, thiol:disulfide interchange protein DsbE